MKRHIRVWMATPLFVAAVLLCLVAPASAADPGITDDTILIGMQGAYTGFGSVYGTGSLDGWMLYWDEVNAGGGVHGRKVKFVVEDDRSTPADAVASAKKLIERDRAFLIIFHGLSTGFAAAKPYFLAQQTPVLTGVVSGPVVTRPFAKHIFRLTSINDQLQGWALADFAMEHLKGKRVAILRQSDVYGQTGTKYSLQRLKDHWKMEPVIAVDHDPSASDLSSQVLKVKAANPDVTLLWTYLKPATIFIRQAKEQGLKTQFIGCGAVSSEAFVRNVGEPGVGTILIANVPIFQDSSDPLMVKFREKFKAKFPAKIAQLTGYEITGYHQGMMVHEALKRAGRDLTRAKLIAALETIRNFDTGYSYTSSFYADNHEAIHGVRFAIVLPGSNWIHLNPLVGSKEMVDQIINAKE